eukprot:CAMPEP_0204607320 /NCGR_PEP_ID=MMETSP0661-20131031/59645_1 /ASSEMBLY_ACC=CAM_ASM_000606 /TAXON_ID=109239 /ORGANISM="Alexandrium margalefi, Strain AMGDE01CS-322" /LENGTH=116 /DNA_ID=CAMNT_0051618727 /DNA_START=69 /DNA_END=419 /DNA_ORIENTATION=+
MARLRLPTALLAAVAAVGASAAACTDYAAPRGSSPCRHTSITSEEHCGDCCKDVLQRGRFKWDSGKCSCLTSSPRLWSGTPDELLLCSGSGALAAGAGPTLSALAGVVAAALATQP